MVNNKVALVTGGVSGIGLAAVKILLENGIRGVSIVDIQEKEGKKVTDELNKKFGCSGENSRVIYINADVTNKQQLNCAFKTTVNKYKNLDIVFNNAGIVDEIDWKKCYDVNLYATSDCCVMAMEDYLPKYKTCPDPIIVNTASLTGLEACEGIPHCTVTKFGLIGLTLSFGSENHYKRSGVRVAAICPGITCTPMFGNVEKRIVYKKFSNDFFAKQKSQEGGFVGKTFLHIVQCGKSGSIWIIDGGEQKEIKYPNIFR